MLTHVLAILAFSLQAGCPDSTDSGPSPEAAEEGAIISAAIDSLYAKSATGRLAVQELTRQLPGPVSDELRSYLARAVQASGPIVDDYIRRNNTACDLRAFLRKSPSTTNVSFVAADSLALLRQASLDDYWRMFYDRYRGSGGLITVSRPGIDPTGSRAFLHIRHSCGRLCGASGYAWLHKESGRWKVERHIIVGMS